MAKYILLANWTEYATQGLSEAPNVTRLKSVMGQSVCGFGMYATGRLLAPYWPTPA